jgi:hypothetical protein
MVCFLNGEGHGVRLFFGLRYSLARTFLDLANPVPGQHKISSAWPTVSDRDPISIFRRGSDGDLQDRE